jgi:hypothetical protein
MSLDRDKFANTLSQIALPALAGAAGSGAVGAYMSSQSEHPGESPIQRRHRVLRNALVSAGLGGMAGAALPTGLKMLTEPYIGSGIMGGPNLWDKGTDLVLGHAAPLAAAGAVGFGAHKRMGETHDMALKNIYNRLGHKSALPPELAEESGIKALENTDQLKQLFGSGDRATKYILDRLSAGSSNAAGLDRLFQSVDLMRSAKHPGISLNDLQRMYKPQGGALPLEKFPAALHRNPAEVDWHQSYSDYLQRSNSFLDQMVGKAMRPSPFQRIMSSAGGSTIAPESRTLPSKLSPIAEWLASKLRPGTAEVLRGSKQLFRGAGPAGKLLLGLGGIGGVLAANKLQQKVMGN